MTEFVSNYISHQPDPQGFIVYSESEQTVWQTLYSRQKLLVNQFASKEFLQGLEDLNLSAKTIPQIPDINQTLKRLTGWQVAPVSALISAQAFFEHLANRRFPVATFIRRIEELDYVKEPDIFHEIFGHCPMLTHQVYADFMCQYAQTVLNFTEKDWPLLQRFFWFTVEFGLIKQSSLKAYGGGILSSISETRHSIEAPEALRLLFNPLEILRTPYRIDALQAVYFVIDDYRQLYDFVNHDIQSIIARARELGERPSHFEADPDNPNLHILAC